MPSTYNITSKPGANSRRITVATNRTAEQVRDYMHDVARYANVPHSVAHDGMSARLGCITLNSYPEQ